MNTAEIALKLWRHEVTRILSDRFFFNNTCEDQVDDKHLTKNNLMISMLMINMMKKDMMKKDMMMKFMVINFMMKKAQSRYQCQVCL